jgi:hypothetical protein
MYSIFLSQCVEQKSFINEDQRKKFNKIETGVYEIDSGITCSFEMVSGLKVNFFKSCLIGVNVPREVMEIVCGFLNCSEGVAPFNYLRLSVGANPRKLAT